MEYNDPPLLDTAEPVVAEPVAAELKAEHKVELDAESKAEHNWAKQAAEACQQNAPLLTCVATSACMYACLPLALSAFAAGTYLGGVLDYATSWGFQTVHTTWPPLRNNIEQLRHKMKRE